MIATVVGVRVLQQDESPPSEPATASASAAERRFTRIGTTDGEPLSDGEVDQLSTGYGYVLFTKFHAGWDIEAHHADTRRLNAARRDVRVFPYFSTKYWFERNEWGVELDPDWLLRDNEGELVPKLRGGEEQDDGRFIDLANPDYRDWALEVIASWLEAAPYAGVSFDAADPIGDNDPEEIERWTALIGPERIAAYNEGIRDLLDRAGDLVGPDGEVIYNGIAPNPIRGTGRDLDLLEVADGALDEKFCIDRKGEPLAIDEDLALMADVEDDRLFLRTNLPEGLSPEDRDRLRRLCVGTFLLGWVPGRTFFQIGDTYTTDQLVAENAPEVEVDVGRPTGPAEGTTVRTRPFANGLIVVNLGGSPATFEMPSPLSAMEGGRTADRYEAGASVTIDPLDALLLVTPR